MLLYGWLFYSHFGTDYQPTSNISQRDIFQPINSIWRVSYLPFRHTLSNRNFVGCSIVGICSTVYHNEQKSGQKSYIRCNIALRNGWWLCMHLLHFAVLPTFFPCSIIGAEHQ